MNIATLILPLFAFAADEEPLPRGLSLTEERRPAKAQEETVPQRPDEPPDRSRRGVMEYYYRNAELDLGMLYTNYDNDLQLESDLGFYVRSGVRFAHGLSMHVAYRHADFSSSENPGKIDENVLIRAVLFGGAYRYEATREFTVLASLAGGFQRWETNLHGFSDDTGLVFNGELSGTVRLWTVLRLKIGVAFDLANTDFHQDSRSWNTSLSGLLGFELGL